MLITAQYGSLYNTINNLSSDCGPKFIYVRDF